MADNISERKGSFRQWSPESIEWYERASLYTHYHEQLIRYLLPHLRNSDHCCELACGTGTLARALAPHVASYTANDIDEEAVAHNQEMLRQDSQGNLRQLEIIPGNWKYALAGRQFDTVIFSFFGAVLRNWEELKSLAGRQIIAVAYGGEAKRPEDGKKSKQEHAEDIIEFLRERQIPYSAEFTELEFGQPLQSMDEARRYVQYYYPFADDQIESFLNRKLEKREDGTLYFPKTKKLGIVVIRMDENSR